jgi:predicted AlkP superfamily pyrophosphatase or phosphodiesterase
MAVKYNKTMPFSQRIDMIVDWLSKPASERPALVMAYFDQPDEVGHYHTSDAQVNLELEYMESVLNYLFTALHKAGMFECTNIIILSDHGRGWWVFLAAWSGF